MVTVVLILGRFPGQEVGVRGSQALIVVVSGGHPVNNRSAEMLTERTLTEAILKISIGLNSSYFFRDQKKLFLTLKAKKRVLFSIKNKYYYALL